MAILKGSISDNTGKPIASVSIQVYLADTTTPASLYSDKAMTIGMTNPMTTETDGSFMCYLAAGWYDLVPTKAGVTFDTTDFEDEFAPATKASELSNTPAGDIAATDVQTALNELDSEKVGIGTADTITAVHTFNPSSVQAPFAVGDNGRFQEVTNLFANVTKSWRDYFLREHWLGGTASTGNAGELGWNYVVTGAASKVAPDTDGQASFQISTGSLANDTSYCYLGNVRGDKRLIFEMHIALSAISTIKAKVGLPGNYTSGDRSDTNGIYFHFDSSSDADWQAVTRSSSSETVTDTAVAASTSKTKLRIELRTVSDGGVSDVKFYINDTLVATHTTNIPVVGGFIAFIVKTLAAASAKEIKSFFMHFYQRLG